MQKRYRKRNFILLFQDTDLMKRIFTLVIIVSSVMTGFSQEESWLSFPIRTNDSTAIDTSEKVTLNYDSQDGVVNIHKDDRIDKLKEFVRVGEDGIDGVLIDGYRVMIYFDQDKTKSEQQKAHFISLYDEHKAYVDYVAPNYRVRVGNFRTKLEAEKLKQEILPMFPTAIVVQDKIQLPVIEGQEPANGSNQ